MGSNLKNKKTANRNSFSPIVCISAVVILFLFNGCFKKSEPVKETAKNEEFATGNSGEIYSGKKNPTEQVATDPSDKTAEVPPPKSKPPPVDKKNPVAKTPKDSDESPRLSRDSYKQTPIGYYLIGKDDSEVRIENVEETIDSLRGDYTKCIKSAGKKLEKMNICLDASFEKCKKQSKKDDSKDATVNPSDLRIRCQVAVTKLEDDAFPREENPNPASMYDDEMNQDQIDALAADLKADYEVCSKSGTDTGWKKRERCFSSAREKCHVRHGGSREPSNEVSIYCKVAIGELECSVYPDTEHCKSLKEDKSKDKEL